MLDLENMGKHICVIGPSNSGKSTLANRLSNKILAPVIHLDQLAHIAGTDWKRKDETEFVTEHDKALCKEEWIIEGNYSICMPQRFSQASHVIWLDPPLLGFLLRYVLRCLKSDKTRPGGLQNATSEWSWALIKFTFCTYPKNRKKYNALLEKSGVPVLHITSMQKLNAYYKHWGLSCPQG